MRYTLESINEIKTIFDEGIYPKVAYEGALQADEDALDYIEFKPKGVVIA